MEGHKDCRMIKAITMEIWVDVILTSFRKKWKNMKKISNNVMGVVVEEIWVDNDFPWV